MQASGISRRGPGGHTRSTATLLSADRYSDTGRKTRSLSRPAHLAETKSRWDGAVSLAAGRSGVITSQRSERRAQERTPHRASGQHRALAAEFPHEGRDMPCSPSALDNLAVGVPSVVQPWTPRVTGSRGPRSPQLGTWRETARPRPPLRPSAATGKSRPRRSSPAEPRSPTLSSRLARAFPGTEIWWLRLPKPSPWPSLREERLELKSRDFCAGGPSPHPRQGDPHGERSPRRRKANRELVVTGDNVCRTTTQSKDGKRTIHRRDGTVWHRTGRPPATSTERALWIAGGTIDDPPRKRDDPPQSRAAAQAMTPESGDRGRGAGGGGGRGGNRERGREELKRCPSPARRPAKRWTRYGQGPLPVVPGTTKTITAGCAIAPRNELTREAPFLPEALRI